MIAAECSCLPHPSLTQNGQELDQEIDSMARPLNKLSTIFVAKKDLRPGDTLDSIGEYAYRAWIMTYEGAAAAQAIPCGLLEMGKVTKPIRKGELITYGNTTVDQTSRIVALRRRQDELLAGLN
jgi:predicted homoserine dehydrogenase-like protein